MVTVFQNFQLIESCLYDSSDSKNQYDFHHKSMNLSLCSTYRIGASRNRLLSRMAAAERPNCDAQYSDKSGEQKTKE